ncbi:MAG: rhomboid family intramembrane serine protease [Bdellovibrionales bacterium]
MAASNKMHDVAVPAIVIVNLIVFSLWNYSQSPEIVQFLNDNFISGRPAIGENRYWTLITALFAHRDFVHLFISIFGLLIFGFLAEDLLGSKMFFEFFIVSGVVGAMNHCMIAPLLDRPDAVIYGSTGPLAGIMVLCSLIYRRKTIWLLKIFPIKPIWGAGLFLALDTIDLFMHDDGVSAPIGHASHIGAAITAVVFYNKVLRYRVWRNLQWIGGEELLPVRVEKKTGWLIPCADAEVFDKTLEYYKGVLGLVPDKQGTHPFDSQFGRFANIKMPNGMVEIVELHPSVRGIYTAPVMSLTVDNFTQAVKNLDKRKCEFVTEIFTPKDNWAVTFCRGPDGHMYQYSGPYDGS